MDQIHNEMAAGTITAIQSLNQAELWMKEVEVLPDMWNHKYTRGMLVQQNASEVAKRSQTEIELLLSEKEKEKQTSNVSPKKLSKNAKKRNKRAGSSTTTRFWLTFAQLPPQSQPSPMRQPSGNTSRTLSSTASSGAYPRCFLPRVLF